MLIRCGFWGLFQFAYLLQKCYLLQRISRHLKQTARLWKIYMGSHGPQPTPPPGQQNQIVFVLINGMECQLISIADLPLFLPLVTCLIISTFHKLCKSCVTCTLLTHLLVFSYYLMVGNRELHMIVTLLPMLASLFLFFPPWSRGRHTHITNGL